MFTFLGDPGILSIDILTVSQVRLGSQEFTTYPFENLQTNLTGEC